MTNIRIDINALDKAYKTIIANPPSAELLTAVRDICIIISTTGRQVRSKALPEHATPPTQEQLEVLNEQDRVATAITDLEFAVEKMRPSQENDYDQAVFKCYGDYQKCKKQNNNKLVCASLLIICLAQQVIPLAGGQ